MNCIYKLSESFSYLSKEICALSFNIFSVKASYLIFRRKIIFLNL